MNTISVGSQNASAAIPLLTQYPGRILEIDNNDAISLAMSKMIDREGVRLIEVARYRNPIEIPALDPDHKIGVGKFFYYVLKTEAI